MSRNIFSLEGKVIVVTGATGVLGGSFVEAIAAAGGVVGVLGRNEKVARSAAKAFHSIDLKQIFAESNPRQVSLS